MPKQKKNKIGLVFYIYIINYIFIFTLVLLRILDIYITYNLLEDSQFSEANPITAYMILNLNPIFVYLISVLPVALFGLVNYYARKDNYYLIFISITSILLLVYFYIPIANNINLRNEVEI